MRYVIVCALAAVAVVAGVLHAAGEQGRPGLTAQVVGLEVAAETPSDLRFGTFPGLARTGLAVLIRSTDKAIVGFDAEASRLTLLQDDKGTDLRVGSGPPLQQPQTFAFISTDQDGKAVMFYLFGNGNPAAGSTRIKAEATAALRLGTTLETLRQENVPLKQGSRIAVGPVPLTISDVQTDGGFRAPMTVTLAADQILEAISDIAFEDASGKAIETKDNGLATATGVGGMSVKKWIVFSKKVDSATVVIKYWKGLETVQVPLKLEAGLSLQ